MEQPTATGHLNRPARMSEPGGHFVSPSGFLCITKKQFYVRS